MTAMTPAPRREALARQHLQTLARRAGPTPRQRFRLALLQRWGRRYLASPGEPADSAQRILVIRPDHLGDLLFATPALHRLRACYPNASITALVGPWGQQVLATNPDIDQMLTCPFPGFTRQPKKNLWAPYRLLRDQAKRLRSMQFDLAIILRFDHWWGAWLAAAAGIPQRLGYDVAEVRPFLTQAVVYVPGRHEVVQNVALVMAARGVSVIDSEKPTPYRVSRLWRLRFEPTKQDSLAADRLLVDVGMGEPAAERLVAIHPGSGAAVKRWRTAAWAALVGHLIRQEGARVIFTGSGHEAAVIDPILEMLDDSLQSRALSLAGRTDIGSLAALYRRCALVVGPDSGPLHLAVAMDTPTVHLYGPVDHRTFGPWGTPQRHRVVTTDWACIPCNRLDWPDRAVFEHGCVRDVPVATVLTAAKLLLAGR